MITSGGSCLCLVPASLMLLLLVVAIAESASTQIEASSSLNNIASQQQHQPQKYSNWDNLISEFLDDAGGRLKKSRSISRPAKQTLRFGRRSDPWMAPGAPIGLLQNENLSEAEMMEKLRNFKWPE